MKRRMTNLTFRAFILIVFACALAFLFLLPSISAIDPDLIYKQYSEVDLKIPCYNNGTWCGSTAICNITAMWPNGTILVNNGMMTNQGSFHNYTLSSSQTSVVGVYSDSMVCNDNGHNGKVSFEHEISNSGFEESKERTRTLWIYGFAIFLYLMLIVFAWKTELSWIGFLAGVILSLPGIHLMTFGFGLYDDLLVRGVALVIIAIALITIIIFAYEALSDYDGGDNGDSGSGDGDSGGDEHDYFKS